MKILFKFASRSRPEKFFKCLDNLCQNISDKDNFSILATLDTDDVTMNNDDVKYNLRNYPKVIVDWGLSENKIHAFNRGMDGADFDILINTSDDMLFVEPKFDDIIRADMLENFPDLDGVLHYNDGNQGSNCMTMSIMGKKYYDRTNYIYHPSYENLFCDNEAKDVAVTLGKYKYIDKILFRHNHPAWGLGEMDKQYEKSESRTAWRKDEANYSERKANGFK